MREGGNEERDVYGSLHDSVTGCFVRLCEVAGGYCLLQRSGTLRNFTYPFVTFLFVGIVCAFAAEQSSTGRGKKGSREKSAIVKSLTKPIDSRCGGAYNGAL